MQQTCQFLSYLGDDDDEEFALINIHRINNIHLMPPDSEIEVDEWRVEAFTEDHDVLTLCAGTKDRCQQYLKRLRESLAITIDEHE